MRVTDEFLDYYNRELVFLRDMGDQFAKANAGFFTNAGVDAVACMADMRLVALAALGAREGGGVLTYDQCAAKLNVSVDDVEEWVVRAIARGVVEAKMDQLAQTVVITESHRAVFRNDAQWIAVSTQLKRWKASVRNVSQSVRTQQQQQQVGAS